MTTGKITHAALEVVVVCTTHLPETSAYPVELSGRKMSALTAIKNKDRFLPGSRFVTGARCRILVRARVARVVCTREQLSSIFAGPVEHD